MPKDYEIKLAFLSEMLGEIVGRGFQDEALLAIVERLERLVEAVEKVAEAQSEIADIERLQEKVRLYTPAP